MTVSCRCRGDLPTYPPPPKRERRDKSDLFLPPLAGGGKGGGQRRTGCHAWARCTLRPRSEEAERSGPAPRRPISCAGLRTGGRAQRPQLPVNFQLGMLRGRPSERAPGPSAQTIGVRAPPPPPPLGRTSPSCPASSVGGAIPRSFLLRGASFSRRRDGLDREQARGGQSPGHDTPKLGPAGLALSNFGLMRQAKQPENRFPGKPGNTRPPGDTGRSGRTRGSRAGIARRTFGSTSEAAPCGLSPGALTSQQGRKRRHRNSVPSVSHTTLSRVSSRGEFGFHDLNLFRARPNVAPCSCGETGLAGTISAGACEGRAYRSIRWPCWRRRRAVVRNCFCAALVRARHDPAKRVPFYARCPPLSEG